MEANPPQQNSHAIFMPLPLQGHLNPFIQLAIKLASRGFTITFLVFESTHQEMTLARNSMGHNSSDIFEEARTGPTPLDIRYRVLSDGLHIDFDRTGKLDEYLEWCLFGGMYAQLEKAIGDVISESKPHPNVLVADTFFPWASKIAQKFELKYASFWTEPALVFSLYYHLNLLREHRHFDCPDPRMDPIDYIPGVRSINPNDLPSYLQDKDASTNMHNIIFAAYEDVKSADYVLCNTVEEIEPYTISTLQGFMPFFAVGPILHLRSTQRIGPTSLWAESSCSDWLDSKTDDDSVLYVSFGSLASFNKEEVMEIAYGIMHSKVGFIWVLRPRTTLDEGDDDDDDLLPPGFKDEINGRGIIVPWTNQIDVLSHRAVGGFLTHCGWNSVLESVWYEVPMLCFPVFTDQFTNRKVVVDDWKAGVNLFDEKPVRRDYIAANIKKFMSPKVRQVLRKNAQEVRKIFNTALDDNGSSNKNLDLFIDNLKK